MSAGFVQARLFLPVFFLFMVVAPDLAQTSSSREGAGDMMFHQGEEVVLDGQVDYTPQGVVMFTSGEERMVFLDGVAASGEPGQHIMVVGYPYKKGNSYHINVTGYTFLEQ